MTPHLKKFDSANMRSWMGIPHNDHQRWCRLKSQKKIQHCHCWDAIHWLGDSQNFEDWSNFLTKIDKIGNKPNVKQLETTKDTCVIWIEWCVSNILKIAGHCNPNPTKELPMTPVTNSTFPIMQCSSWMNWKLPQFGGLINISDKIQKKNVDSHVHKSGSLCRYTCRIDDNGICQYWDDVWKFSTKIGNNRINSKVTKIENSVRCWVNKIKLCFQAAENWWKLQPISGTRKIRKMKTLWFLRQCECIRNCQDWEIDVNPKQQTSEIVSIEMSKKLNPLSRHGTNYINLRFV